MPLDRKQILTKCPRELNNALLVLGKEFKLKNTTNQVKFSSSKTDLKLAAN